MSRLWVLMAAFLIATSFCTAQDRGTIRGTVTDPTGAALAEGVVTIRNINTGFTQTTKTGSDGGYTFLYLPAGGRKAGVPKNGNERCGCSRRDGD